MAESERGVRFQRGELLLGSEGMRRLHECRVIVFGVGGVGSWCVEALVRSGVGHITIVDPDDVAAGNINRQLPALVPTVGCPKVEVMCRRMLEINPDLDITALQTMYDELTAPGFRLGDYDYVVDAIDTIGCKMLLIENALESGAELLSSMGAALKGDFSKIEIADFSKVYGCPLARALRQRFKRSGGMPRRRFRCVFSPELLKNHSEDVEVAEVQSGPASQAKRGANGSLMHITASFGMALAGEIIRQFIPAE